MSGRNKQLVIQFALLLCAGLSLPARAETGCGGPFFAEPTCGSTCAQANCIDVSFSQDGTLFQCCPYTAGTPELPTSLSPFGLAVVLVIGCYGWRRWRRRRA